MTFEDILAEYRQIDMSTYGYYRLAAATPRVRVADVAYNREEMVRAMKEAAANGAHAVLFPELCLTGASCGDLFFIPHLHQAALRALTQFAADTARLSIPAILSLPLEVESGIYSVAAVVQGGHVLGLVPKSILPNNRSHYEQRQFRPASDLRVSEVNLPGFGIVPIGTDLIFSDGADFVFGIEIGDDLQGLIPPSSTLALQGARVIFNPAASMALACGAQYTRTMVQQQSSRCLSAYVYASAGVGESTQDAVYGGQAIIADNGRIAAENKLFSREIGIIYADIDLQRLAVARSSESSYNDCRVALNAAPARRIMLAKFDARCDLAYAWLPSRPFVPEPHECTARCEEILNIQASALAKRIEHTHAKTLVIGISGGLDSTLALMVSVRACRMLGMPNSSILAVTMPGFGTTGRTHSNAVAMMKLLGVTFKEVNIKESCLLQFQDLDFDPSLRTSTYENVQARQRTSLLMNLANKTGGMVVGTGDLSEIALGWSTYNGDHMSMYAVNCSVPKTLIRCLLAHEAAHCEKDLAETIQDVIDTPVSPELLPPAEDGSMEQKTEDILGPYDLHDFFLYHFIKYGAEPTKLRVLAQVAFAGEFSEQLIGRTLEIFLRRFFQQQFKRSCMPDGPKVGTIALSPRGDWRMPTDACGELWKP